MTYPQDQTAGHYPCALLAGASCSFAGPEFIVGILTSIIVANGPARILVKSTTLIPASGLSSFTMAGVEKLRRCDIEDAYGGTPGGADKVLPHCKGLSLNRAIRSMFVSVV